MPLPAPRYAAMLGRARAPARRRVWLVNTGWTGGAFGVGRRIPLAQTRAVVRAALAGKLDDVALREDPVFGLRVPVEVPGVDTGLLDPRGTWDDPAAFDAQAAALAGMFRENFAALSAAVPPEVREAGPLAR